MALRVMQIYVPNGSRETPEDLLNEREVLGCWRDEDRDRSVLSLLVAAEQTEPIMDQFEKEFAGVDGFRVVLLPVEAVLPRPSMEELKNNEAEANRESAADSERISRQELYEEVNESIGVTRVYIALTILSAVVAAVGLMRDDVAVIIGAMVIAPLLGPNVAMALATTLGDTDLLRRSLLTKVVGVMSAFGLAVLIGALFAVDPESPAIESRTSVAIGDILLALAAGAAGTLAVTRGLPGAVIGVMVAVALMPPLVAAGLLLGAGYTALAAGALLLTGSNVICINLAGIVTFLTQGVRPRSWWDVERAKWGTIKAISAWTILLILLLVILWLNGEREYFW